MIWIISPKGLKFTCVGVNRMMWAAGAVAAMSSITFPAVSALVSQSADPDKQGDFPSLLPLFYFGLSSIFSSSIIALLWIFYGFAGAVCVTQLYGEIDPVQA